MIEKPFRAAMLLRLIEETLAAAKRVARVVTLERTGATEPRCVPVGLEWLGGRSAH